ncbi:MAG: hypothetical protein L0I79_06760 [Atopostipes sp.]|nr:hypothetical protein [Atopostipes sp.]
MVETLITLLISSFLIFLPVLSISQVVHSVETDLFFRELNSNIKMMQSHAVLEGENTSIEFIPKQNSIRFKVFSKDYSANHPLNRTIELEETNFTFYGDKYLSFYFAANTGNLSVTDNHWRVRFKGKKALYELVFKLGSGRFEVKKI